MGFSRGRKWLEPERERLALLVASGWTAGEIGRELKRTRNEVLGAAHRQRLTFRHGLKGPRHHDRPPVLDRLPGTPEPEPVEEIPAPQILPGHKCTVEGCTRNRLRQTPYGLCHHHDQDRINAKRKAA